MVMYIELSACGLHSAATVFNATPGRHQVCCTPTERDINTCNKTRETETETHTDTEKDTEREAERERERERERPTAPLPIATIVGVLFTTCYQRHRLPSAKNRAKVATYTRVQRHLGVSIIFLFPS